MQFKLTPKIPIKGFRPMGSKGETTAVKQKEWTEGSIDGVFGYESFVYLLSGILEGAAITTPSGATSTRRWTFLPANFTADDYITYTVECGTTGGFAERTTFALINDLKARFTREEAAISGALIAQKLIDGITITGSPTDIPEKPADPDQTSLFVGSALTNEIQTVTLGGPSAGTFLLTFTDPFQANAVQTASILYTDTGATVQTRLENLSNIQVGDVTVTGGAGGPYVCTFAGRFASINVPILVGDFTGLTGGSPTIVESPQGGLTRLTRCLEFEWALAGRFAPIFTLEQATPSFSAEVERGLQNTSQLVLEHDSTSVAFMTDLRAKTTKYLKQVCIGPTIEGDFTFRSELTFPFKFGESAREDKNDIWGATYNLIPIYDTTFGGWVKWVVDNTRTAL